MQALQVSRSEARLVPSRVHPWVLYCCDATLLSSGCVTGSLMAGKSEYYSIVHREYQGVRCLLA